MINAAEEPQVAVFKLDPRDAITVGQDANLLHENGECEAVAGARWPLVQDSLPDIVLVEGPHWCPACSRRHRPA